MTPDHDQRTAWARACADRVHAVRRGRARMAVVRWQTDRDPDAASALLAEPRLTPRQVGWLRHGLLRSMLHDHADPRRIGPAIASTLATGDAEGLVPQGLALDDGRLLQTSYRRGAARLDVLDAETGELLHTVDLGGGEGRPPRHVGGIAVHGGSIWVTSAGSPPHLFRYDLADLATTAPRGRLEPAGTPQPVGAGSYAAAHGDTLYLGTFERHGPGMLLAHRRDGATWVQVGAPLPTPPCTQGIALVAEHLVVSASHGRGRPGTLHAYRLADLRAGSLDDPVARLIVPTMVEGIVAGPRGIIATYESGAAAYSEARYRRRHRLWPSTTMTVTPYADLGLPVAPAAVRPVAARRPLAPDLPGLDLAGLDLPELAARVAAFVAETERWDAEGRIAPGITVDTLASSRPDRALRRWLAGRIDRPRR